LRSFTLFFTRTRSKNELHRFWSVVDLGKSCLGVSVSFSSFRFEKIGSGFTSSLHFRFMFFTFRVTSREDTTKNDVVALALGVRADESIGKHSRRSNKERNELHI
jgi:hypothetical protein